MKIALITGGPSSERDVSVASSISILKALKNNGHEVRVIDPVFGKDQPGEEEIFSHKVGRDSPSYELISRLSANSGSKILECFSGNVFDDIDFAFIGLHGKFGEDGSVQRLLELRGVRYSGSGVFASALAMDKDMTKVLLRSNDLCTPDWFALERSRMKSPEEIDKIISSSFGYPCVIKPNDEGSTVGLTIVQPDVEDVQLENAVETAFRYSDKIIVEEYSKGRELTVPILGDEAFPVIEIKPKDGFYDYEHKYTKGLTEYFCPAEIPDRLRDEAMNAALSAHKAIGCSVYSRVDFILDEDEKLQCLEVNTLPGMTETSLVPKSAVARGMSFDELIQTIIELSLKKS